MVNQEPMMAMHVYMQGMQSLMSEIREGDEPLRRQQLLQEHMHQQETTDVSVILAGIEAGADRTQAGQFSFSNARLPGSSNHSSAS